MTKYTFKDMITFRNVSVHKLKSSGVKPQAHSKGFKNCIDTFLCRTFLQHVQNAFVSNSKELSEFLSSLADTEGETH